MSKTKSDKRRLNICPLEIYDGTFDELSRIGIKSSYSDPLLKNLTASVIADRLGSKSVDYVRNRYLYDWKRDVSLDPNAFDLRTIHFLDVSIDELQKHLVANSHNLIYSEIQTISDMTLAKGLGTLRVALDLSSKGLLHEVLTLCRSSLEMIMWAFTTFDLPNEKDPFEFLPERAISGFKTHFPYAGKYYGYLSGFSHWRKDTHTRAFNFEEEYVAVVYASGRNKLGSGSKRDAYDPPVRRRLHKKVRLIEMQTGLQELPTRDPSGFEKNLQETARMARIFYRAGRPTCEQVFCRYF